MKKLQAAKNKGGEDPAFAFWFKLFKAIRTNATRPEQPERPTTRS